MAQIGEFIRLYKLPNHVIEQVLEGLDNPSVEWSQHHWYNHSKKERHTYENKVEPRVANLDKVIDSFMVEIHHNIISYCSNFSEKLFISNYSNPRFNRYTKGNNMKSHFDHVHSIFDGKNRGIPILSILISLSSNFEGGNFVFNLVDEEKPYRLESGDMIVFPSSFMYPHEVKPILEGERITCVCWAF